MAINIDAYKELMQLSSKKNVTVVAVSKNKPVSDIQDLYDIGHRDFGENYVQELIQKQLLLPQDIRWHFIGHLQRNKVKYILPFVYMIHGVDSYQLLEEIDRQAVKNERQVKCLLQVHIAQESTKFGLSLEELLRIVDDLPKLELINQLKNTTISGLMGMASFTEEQDQVRKEFRYLKMAFDECRKRMIRASEFDTLSMGMSSDYKLALEEGSTMVRVGSMLFGQRDPL
ncbi:MAG: YggS family pyridoxal phosphate-dependent enzyme [Chitinophagaceae bacterium]|nr:MAG: YggS family pyridoxal phosphate-dependent enzyme [Chitinophagaceae bacterium]